MTTSRRPNAPLVTGLGALIAVAMALPLLAPSCSDFQPGQKLFAKGSLIIPMDVCYQYQTDGVRPTYTPSASCPGAVTENGDVIKAYGLVYQLIRNGVAVYWIIDPAKTSLTAPDLTLQFNPGFPVLKYDWTGAAPSVAPNTSVSHSVTYLGGPFIVDGSDAAKATQIFQKYKSTFRPTATTGVNVHVSNIAFTASVAKMLAGGWSAGGATPPKLALLNIGSSGAGSKNSEVVIRGYLQRAGLDISEPDPANPAVLLAAGGSASGVHGTIYDRLVMEDFIPTAAGNVLTSNLFMNGYQILWVPHWAAPSSCSDCPPGTSCPCANKYPAATIAQALRTIGAFGAAGKDVFAECAGLGSFEGVLNSNTYGTAVAETHFQTVVPIPLVGALGINTNTTATPIYQPGYFASPLMQLGDYPFIPQTGAIQNYKPASASSGYVNVTGASDNTVRLISESNGGGAYDIFTHRPGLKTGHGTYVYLGGHSYSGTDGAFEVGGTRLVLNTLFNLGAGCTESGVACDTGLPGVCAKGVFKCRTDGTTYCAQTVFPSPEVCNGLDDDCNGAIDDNLKDPDTGALLSAGCYSGPATTRNVGICHDGARSCVKNADGSYGLTACQGQVTPRPEECNGLDDNCNGLVDESLTRACYGGDVSTIDPVTGLPIGACKAGVETCNAGNWGDCRICSSTETQLPTPPADCQILPRADDCTCAECGSGGKDWNCDGQIALCGKCTDGTIQGCYEGPAGTSGVGPCHAGTQACAGGNWGACTGQVVPVAEICGNGVDDNCNGSIDEPSVCGECLPGSIDPVACWTGLPGVVFHDPAAPVGTPAHDSICAKGQRTCGADSRWEACGSAKLQTLPGAEICNGLDDDCNGVVDDGAQCGPDFACRNGFCVYDTCGPEFPCTEGYACVTGHCQLAGCGTGASCAPGSACQNGACVDPNAGLTCGAGSAPAGGFCTGGACYEAGCAAGMLCLGGACVADPCGGVICPAGTFCRQGDCVQACAFVACGAGQRCDLDGFCVADACAGKTCNPTQTCLGGNCVADPCSVTSCGRGQACLAGQCVDDPCTGIACPAGQCQGGQCYSTGSTASAPPQTTSSGCGCGSAGAGTPLALLALLAFAPLARRRRRPQGGGAALLGLLLLVVAASGCKKETSFDPASCVGLGATVSACPGENRCVDVAFDPSHCGTCDKACGAGNTCVDSGCFPASTVAPFITAVSPATLNLGGLEPVRVDLTGQRFDASATVRVTRLTGTTTYAANVIDAGHLSALVDLRGALADTWKFRVVNSDRVISNQKLVPVNVPTPAIIALTPGSAEVGLSLVLRVEGTGLMVNSLCFFGSASEQVALPATLTTAGLECQLDLSTHQPGPYQVWVANPTGAGSPVLSNKVPFSATSNAAPTLTSLSPSTARKGSVKPLTVTGAGFDVTSKAVFVATIPPAGPVEVPQGTSFLSTNQLTVGALDLSLCPGPVTPCPSTGEGTAPGASYVVKVRSGASGAVQTASLPFVISTNPPEISSLVPAFAYQGETKAVLVQGLNIPTGTVVQLGPTGGLFADVPTSAVTSTSATGTFDLKGTPPGSVPAGSYQVRLRLPAGAGYSSPLPFNVISNTAILQSVTPVSGTQGAFPVPVTFNVANLRPLYGDVRVVFSAQPNALLPTSGTASPFTASLDLQGLDAGLHTLQVKNPDGAALSNPVNFTVTPGPPTLLSVSPASVAQQLTRVPVAITGANFAKPDASGSGGSVVHVFANCTPVIVSGTFTGCTPTGTPYIPDQALPPAYNTVTVTSSTRIDVLFDTSSAIPATYSLWVWNPGGSPWQLSNTLLNAFTVTP
jgi:MYXO-CTERM domain-containing protein